MTEETPRSSPVAGIPGVLVFILVMVEIAVFLFMGGSSVAAEPNPILDFFPGVVILVIIALGIIFFFSIERTQKRSKNVGKSNT